MPFRNCRARLLLRIAYLVRLVGMMFFRINSRMRDALPVD